MLEITTLGGISIRLDSELVQLRTRKVEAMLIYLAIKKRPQSRELLAELFWGKSNYTNQMSNLRVAISNLRKKIGSYISISRDTIGLDIGKKLWLDITAIKEYQKKGNYLFAVNLYRGDFLEGFFIRDCPEYEKWVVEERENSRRLIQEIYYEVIKEKIDEGDYSFGIEICRKLLGLNPYDESANRNLIRLLALDKKRSQALEQYNIFSKILFDEFNVEPEDKTTALVELIQLGEFNDKNFVKTSLFQHNFQPRKPLFLQENYRIENFKRELFIGRNRELIRLGNTLKNTVSGKGRVVFISGEPGSGKTKILNEFSQIAQNAHSKLIVVSGACNAYSGIGDPYSPFREIFSMLIGDVEDQWKAGIISLDHAGTLWDFLPEVATLLITKGPNLVNVLVDGETLYSHVAAAIPQKKNLLNQIQMLIKKEFFSRRGLQPNLLFAQCANFFHTLSEHKPILIILDDLQWSDAASISLLFHICRGIKNNKIMIVGAFRPTDIKLGRGGDRHPLEHVISEFKRQYGDIVIDLDNIPTSERSHFIDKYVDNELNQISYSFRQHLFKLTNGNPLFTIEILRVMQERGDLENIDGQWNLSNEINWEAFPARIDGIIEERINRLDNDLWQILKVGCIEGEIFTSEVVANILNIDHLCILDKLSNYLEKRHRLVKEVSEKIIDDSLVVQYKISHWLIQQYLYNSLGEGERHLLHCKVGESLETIFKNNLEQIASKLAIHFLEGKKFNEAIKYHFMAARSAFAGYAYLESVAHIDQALSIVDDNDLSKQYELLLLSESTHEITADRHRQFQDLGELEKISKSLDNPKMQADVALRKALFGYKIGNYKESIKASKDAIQLAQKVNDTEAEASGHYHFGRSLWNMGEYEEAKENLNKSLGKAKNIGQSIIAADCLRNLGIIAELEYEFDKAESYHHQALQIQQDTIDLRGEASTLNSLGILFRINGNYNEAKNYFFQAINIWSKLGDILGQASWFAHIGLVNFSLGEWKECQKNLEQSLLMQQQMKNKNGEAFTLNDLGHFHLKRGHFDIAYDYFKEALPVWEDLGKQNGMGYLQNHLGSYYLTLGDFFNARNHLEIALEIATTSSNILCEAEVLNNLSLLSIEKGDFMTAKEFNKKVLEISKKISNRNLLGLGMIILGRVKEGIYQFDEAEENYQKAIKIFSELGRNHIGIEPLAGLARISLTKKDSFAAEKYVSKILNHIENNDLDGTYDPGLILLTCCKVLNVSQDLGEKEIIKRGNKFLEFRVSNIKTKNQRNSFLTNISSNRELKKYIKART